METTSDSMHTNGIDENTCLISVLSSCFTANVSVSRPGVEPTAIRHSLEFRQRSELNRTPSPRPAVGWEIPNCGDIFRFNTGTRKQIQNDSHLKSILWIQRCRHGFQRDLLWMQRPIPGSVADIKFAGCRLLPDGRQSLFATVGDPDGQLLTMLSVQAPGRP